MKAVSEFKGFIKEPDGSYTAVILTRCNDHFSTSFAWLTALTLEKFQGDHDYLIEKFCRQASENIEYNCREIDRLERDLMYGAANWPPVEFLSQGDWYG